MKPTVEVVPLVWVQSKYFQNISIAWCPLFEKNYYEEKPGGRVKIEARRAERIKAVLLINGKPIAEAKTKWLVKHAC